MPKNRDKSRKSGIIERIKSSAESFGMTDGGRVDIRSNREVTVGGCKRIVRYTPEEIILSVGKGKKIAVVGNELSCTSYFVGAVVIEGRILRVEMRDWGNGEK